jgi:hypothetical protein
MRLAWRHAQLAVFAIEPDAKPGVVWTGLGAQLPHRVPKGGVDPPCCPRCNAEPLAAQVVGYPGAAMHRHVWCPDCQWPIPLGPRNALPPPAEPARYPPPTRLTDVLGYSTMGPDIRTVRDDDAVSDALSRAGLKLELRTGFTIGFGGGGGGGVLALDGGLAWVHFDGFGGGRIRGEWVFGYQFLAWLCDEIGVARPRRSKSLPRVRADAVRASVNAIPRRHVERLFKIRTSDQLRALADLQSAHWARVAHAELAEQTHLPFLDDADRDRPQG